MLQVRCLCKMPTHRTWKTRQIMQGLLPEQGGQALTELGWSHTKGPMEYICFWTMCLSVPITVYSSSSLQWLRTPWCKFVTLSHWTDISIDFGPVFSPPLVTVPKNNIHNIDSYFMLVLHCSKTCACQPKNERREWCWATLFGRCSHTRSKHLSHK